jgi:phosphoribosylformylglycinamidine synthase II
MAATQQEATIDQAKKLGLRENEFEMIKEILGRTPNSTEIDIYSVLWSERCSSKNSIQWLNKLPKASQDIVDLGDGIGCTIKIEEKGKSQRDSFSSGAQPMAQLNAFYFGNIEEKSTKQDIKSAIKNVNDSTPVVGNELFFDDSYNSNPITRQFTAGIVDTKNVISAQASGAENPVFVVGIDLDSKQKKSLLEATIELSKSDALVGIQDLGRGGIAGSSSEMAFAGGIGMDIWMDKISTKQKNQNPTDKITSESKGRLLVVKKGKEQIVKELFSKKDISIQEIGVVTEGPNIRYFDGETLIADLPCKSLVRGEGTPQYERDIEEPAYFEKLKEFHIDDIVYPEDLKEIAIFLLKHQNIASTKWVNDQLNAMIGSEKTTSDAAVVNVEGTKKALAISLANNPRYIHANPQLGAAMTVAQAARDIVCSGGVPSGITHSLNFGNQYNPEHYWQFAEAIKGISKVCSRFNTPVLNGNVSFDKDASNDKPFFPTPTIGMVGVAEKENVMSLDFKYKGDLIFILGENLEDVGSSEYLTSYHNIKESPAPYFNLEKEFELQETLKGLIKTKYVNAVHSVSKGGIFIALAKMGMTNELGFDIVTDAEVREDAFLYGEAAGRVIATVTEDFEDEFIEFMMNSKTQFTLLGHVTKGKMVVDDEHYGFIKEAKDIYENALGLYIEK